MPVRLIAVCKVVNYLVASFSLKIAELSVKISQIIVFDAKLRFVLLASLHSPIFSEDEATI